MRATGRTSHSHRDPSRPGRGGDRLDLSIAAITHRLTSIRANLARRLIGTAEDARYAERVEPRRSWLTPPRVMLGRAEGATAPAPGAPLPWAHFPESHFPESQFSEADFSESHFHEPDDSVAVDASRIDENASEPGLLVRTPRRPAALAAGPAPRTYPSESVRFTRTPDPVLHERRQRALEAEREAQRQFELLREAEVAARAAAETAHRAAEEEAHRVEEIAQAAALQALRHGEDASLPPWRRPFVPPPGVRYFRSPDRPKVRNEAPRGPVAAPRSGPPQAVAEAWSVVDWSGPQTWFAAADDDTIAFWFPQEALQETLQETLQQVPHAAVAPSIPAPVTPAPECGASLAPSPRPDLPAMLQRLIRFAPPPALEAANAPHRVAPSPARTAPVSAMAARAAIRSAGSSTPVIGTAAQPADLAGPSVSSTPPAPVAIPARPVLLRTPKPAPVEAAPEAVDEEIAERIAEAVAEEPLSREPEPAAASGAVSANVPRAILPERPTMAPANRHLAIAHVSNADYELPSLELLAEPVPSGTEEIDADELEQNALNLQQTVQDFGVRGDILAVRPGPVVTLYELEPAPGTKSSRVIGLSDDIARSMAAVSARVAVVPGRNVIGIELPNPLRETVYLRELLASVDFVATKHKLALCLGKDIGGAPIIADLARMPHLLVAGTTGSGKSVAINTMILSLLYRLKPEECRLIMVDPKMLELSVYDGIPHLLSPVVIDPKKAVIALKWAVREMEERYKKMSKVGVRNIDGYNARLSEARARGETLTRTVQTGFDRQTGEAVYEDEVMDLNPLPYIVIVVDEMADLMMVAGKDIEGAIQRLAQMARAAGIHLIMATQRPSVDVITGTIKANFPTRISFQVTSKIDSRTILGEMGAEQLLGQGDMLFMAGGGRTTRVHGPFCSDLEVEAVVDHLKRQGRPAYLDAVTADDGSGEADKAGEKGARGARARTEREEAEPEAEAPVFDAGAFAPAAFAAPFAAPFASAAGGEAGDLYEQAIAVVLRDRKASTSYIQRRLQIGYNRAASLMERMETEGIVGPANHAGKRDILMESLPMASSSPSLGYDDD